MLRRLLLLLAAVSATFAAEPVALTLKANDVWVMAGDSITAQRQHSNFIEAFCRTRFPGLNLQFRNSGIGGNVTGSILARFDYDVAAFKPTIVSIELGMNDVGRGDDPTGYIKGMTQLIGRIRAINATPVLISSSPVNDGSLPGAWKSDRCRRIDPYTVALRKLADDEKVVMVDQFHPLVVLWGNNKAAAKPINLTGDAVHPGNVGQYTMAATIIGALGFSPEVSSATLKADGTVVEAKRCKLTDVSAAGGKLSFTRLDECSPWPLDPKAKTCLDLLPSIADLSRYVVKVTDLPAGQYTVSLDGQPAATCSAEDLAKGLNLGATTQGALAARSTKLLGLIGNLQGKLNTAFRAASKAKDADKLAAAQKDIDAAEAQLREACAPQAFKVEVAKAP